MGNAVRIIKILDDAIEAMSESSDTIKFGVRFFMSSGIDLSPDEDIADSNENQHNREKEIAREKFKAKCNECPYLDGKFFTVNFDKSSSFDGDIYVRCNFCKPLKELKLSKAARGNAKTHLKLQHPQKHKRYEAYVQSKKSRRSKPKKRLGSKQGRFRTSLTEPFKHNIMHYLLESMIPIDTVETKSFRKIFDDLQIENLEHMTVDSLLRKITQTFKEDIEEIRKIVAETKYVCATVDAWSGNNGRFLGVTLHWIDKETYERKSAAIAFKRFPGNHSKEAIEVHNSYNLTPEKIGAAVTDNESTFVTDFKEHGLHALDRLFSAERSSNLGKNGGAIAHIVEDFSPDDPVKDANFSEHCHRLPHHLRCAIYTLPKVADTGIIGAIQRSVDRNETHLRVLAKCQSLWASSRSPSTKETLRNYLGTELIEPELTRWKSSFDAFQQLVTLKRKLLTWSPEEARGTSSTEPLTESVFDYLEEYVRSTKPLADAVDGLQDEAHSHYGYLLPTLVCLKSKLLSLQDRADMTICRPLVVGMIEALETRFRKMFEFSDEGIAAAIAAVSHPKFKTSWLEDLSVGTQKLVYDRVIEAGAARIGPSTLPDPNVVQSGGASTFKNLVTQNATVNAQLTQYVNDPDESLDMLKNHPVMAKIFRKFNAPLVSSAPVERLFSEATMMELPKFASMSDCHFEERVVVAANLSKCHL